MGETREQRTSRRTYEETLSAYEDRFRHTVPHAIVLCNRVYHDHVGIQALLEKALARGLPVLSDEWLRLKRHWDRHLKVPRRQIRVNIPDE